MNKYSKLILGVLLLSIVTISIGCTYSGKYQKSIFDDNRKIVKESDSHSYNNRIGETTNERSNINFTYFSGTDTIFSLIADEESKVIINFESKIEKGDFKVVLISPDNEVSNIIVGTNQGNETIKIKKGISKVKLVGKNAGGQIDIQIDTDDEVEIKATDR